MHTKNNMDSQDFEYTKKSSQFDLNELEDPDLEPCEGVCPMEEIFIAMVEDWLDRKATQIVKECVQGRPKYKRQNAGLRDSQKK